MLPQEPLLNHAYELILLRTREKIPLEKDWLKIKPLISDGLLNALKAGHNIGVRLRATDLVIDVDPRNFIGRPDIQLKLSAIRAPRVDTPSGGQHIYLRKPADLKIHHTLKAFPGIEFKTRGRQVVAPGSTHPNGGIYDWAFDTYPFPAPDAPASILELIAAVEVAAEVVGGDAVWTPEQLAQALKGLDPIEFRDHEAWFRLMCAAHEATSGLGIEEFVHWSCGDSEYAGADGEIRGRWRSLAAGKEGNAGAGSLLKVLKDHGAGGSAPNLAAADFEDEAEYDPTMAEKPDTLMTKMNRWFKAVDEDGKLRIYSQRHDPVLNRKYWVRYDKQSFWDICESVKHLPMVSVGTKPNGDPAYAPAGVAWLRSTKKTTYDGVVFAPEHTGERTPDGRLNLWRGFAVEPAPGSWGMMKELIFETVVGWNSAHYEYVISWLARAVQRPHLPGQVALVMRGAKGTGKGTLGRAFVRLFGQHGLHITSPELLVGRFNAHMRDCAALFADEAFWAGDKIGESKLKAIVTEPALPFEGKGQNAEMGRNCIHVIMASNEEWVIPAGLDKERRFAVFEVADDQRTTTYWDRLNKQMENGGYAAMLHDLLARDLSKFDVFKVPMTDALVEQKLRTLEPHEAWLFELVENEWGGLNVVEEWPGGQIVVLCTDMQDSLLGFYRRHNKFRAGMESIERHLGRMLFKMIPSTRRYRAERAIDKTSGPKRPWCYVLPVASEAKKQVGKLLGSDNWT